MNVQPQDMFCSNPDCPSCGQKGKGNIIWHYKKTGRLKCKLCNKTFSKDKGTPFFGLKKCRPLLVIIITLVAYGCPVVAIVKAFCLDRRTVYRLLQKAGLHCQSIHEEQVLSPRDHRQVQADEICANVQGGKSWIAMAIAIPSRLWLGASVGKRRSRELIYELAILVKRSVLLTKPLLVATDGLSTYVKAFARAMALRVKQAGQGRPFRLDNPLLCLAQCVKGYVRKGRRWACKGFSYYHVAIGAIGQVKELLKNSQPTPLLNTAYIERINATFRQTMACLARRSRCLLVQTDRLKAWVYLKGTIYNFCQIHPALQDKHTPAMAAGITNHIWSINELLTYQVPPPLWKPTKRGRRSKNDQEILLKWRPDLATS